MNNVQVGDKIFYVTINAGHSYNRNLRTEAVLTTVTNIRDYDSTAKLEAKIPYFGEPRWLLNQNVLIVKQMLCADYNVEVSDYE